MKRFTCGDVIPGCKHTFNADTEQQILDQVAVHARHDHGIDDVPQHVVDQVIAGIQDVTP
ncbi:MAG: DUF1059 domain-containing protein [Edaphobacter sp.]|uniref:DUF1059 domain-containing protein n=1 Tax=Edaphobacter sp. TaxID=1934404 RepID=UPI00238447ED|nr:DUF1059 domain-containing protein [Edaphobacter sp.]MDE1175914.1 DUF1059 domain-containing protein [Edaphobacter sp.]